jgi:lysozyme family protein
MTAFEQACALTLRQEGGMSVVADDPGNWTGGLVGSGVLRGTKFGISAAAFPSLDIQALTLDRARQIYRQRYWVTLGADALPPAVAGLLFDAAVNQGPYCAAVALQSAVMQPLDGLVGPRTLATARAVDPVELHSAIAVFRDIRYRQSPNFERFGRGWILRLMRVVAETARFS